MNKVDMLDAINEKKQQVIDLVNADKLDEAKEAKEELQTMQDKFDLLDDIEVEDKVKVEDAEEVTPMAEIKKDAIHEFAMAARNRFKNTMNEGTAADGGYTVPADILTRINHYKEAKFSLKKLVRVENVTTNTGRRIFQTKASHSGFSSVNEAAAIGQGTAPQFGKIDYAIDKYAGILPVTDELLADSDANITDVLVSWLGDEGVATENTQILSLINPGSTGTNITSAPIDGIKNALNVTLGQAYAEGAAVITNDDGFNFLDTLKVGANSNEYLLKPAKDQTAPTPYTLAVGARLVPVVVVPNAVFPSTVVATGDNAGTYIPFVVGDLNEAVAFFDRQQLSIMTSNVASINVTVNNATTTLSAFENDLTMFRGIMRFDVVSRDSDAIAKLCVKKS